MDFELDRNGNFTEKTVYHNKFHFSSIVTKEIENGRWIQLNDLELDFVNSAIFVLQT